MTMRRIPEPDLMNDWDQAVAYARADFEMPHNDFINRLGQTFSDLPATGHALDLGCGPGDITFRFAQAYPDWKIDGIDGAPAMLKLGQAEVESRGLAEKIAFHQVYLPHEAAPRSSYDFVFSNSLLHHLSEPLDLWRSLKALSKLETPVFIMDLMRPESQTVAAELRQKYAANEPQVLQKDFYNSLLAAYTVDEVQTQLETTHLSHLRLEAVSDRHWIAWGYPQQN